MYISEVQAVMGRRHNQARTWLGTPDIDDRQAYDAITATYPGGWAQFVVDHD